MLVLILLVGPGSNQKRKNWNVFIGALHDIRRILAMFRFRLIHFSYSVAACAVQNLA